MRQINVAIIGWGNVGRFCKKVLQNTPDMNLVGVVRRESSLSQTVEELSDTNVVSDIRDLEHVDVAIVSVPSRLAGDKVYDLLAQGISTVDSFDIHQEILNAKERLDKQAREHNSVCIFGAGWDPGTDSIIRALFQIVSPIGLTTTTFGGSKGGRSMGHTAAVKAIKGVRDAVSLTLPNGPGKQKRQVYVELENGVSFEEIATAIREDDYFKNDPTDVVAVKDISKYDTLNHGGELERTTPDIHQIYRIEGINPLMTANVLVSSVRAAFRAKEKGQFGAYTMIERPLIDFLAGEFEEQLKGY